MMNDYAQIEVRVCGIPALAEVRYNPPEPDIGFPGEIEINQLLTIRGTPARWLERKLDTPDGWEDLYRQIEAIRTAPREEY